MLISKHSGHLRTFEKWKEKNPRLRLVFSLFPSCSQMFVVFYPSAIYSLRFFLCKAMETKWLYIDHNVRFNTSMFLSRAVLTYYAASLLLKYVLLRKKATNWPHAASGFLFEKSTPLLTKSSKTFTWSLLPLNTLAIKLTLNHNNSWSSRRNFFISN